LRQLIAARPGWDVIIRGFTAKGLMPGLPGGG